MTADWLAVGASVRIVWGAREGYEGTVEEINGDVVLVRIVGGKWNGLLIPATISELAPARGHD